MKRWVFGLFFSLVIFSFSNSVFATQVKVATFNTYWFYDDRAPHLNWRDRRKGQTYPQVVNRMAKAVLEIDADIIALQEVEGRGVIEDLNDALGDQKYPYVWVSNGLDAFTGQDVAVLSRYPSVVGPVLAFPSLVEPFKTEGGQPRLAQLQKALRVDVEVGPRQYLTIFSIHLKSKRGGVSSGNERLAQAQIVRTLLRPALEKDNHVIVMGDLNDGVDTPALRRIKGEDGSYELYQTSSSDNFTGKKWTYNYKGDQSQLDHILVSLRLFHSVTQGRVMDFPRKTSDHDAVVIEFDIK